MAKQQNQSGDKSQEIGMFMKNLWFFLFYFALLLIIASFGMIAEV